MNIDEVLDVIEYGIKYYRSANFIRFGVIEYYSLTDIHPGDLSKIAQCKRGQSLGSALRIFAERQYWNLNEIKEETRLATFYSIHDHELTKDEKLSIISKMKDEGFPLIDGIFDASARIFMSKGIEGISREKIRKDVINEYNFATGKEVAFESVSSEKPKVLFKTDKK